MIPDRLREISVEDRSLVEGGEDETANDIEDELGHEKGMVAQGGFQGQIDDEKRSGSE